MDWEWVNLGSLEAHLKVWRAWETDFCSKIKWAICCWVGTGDDDDDHDGDNDDEMGFDCGLRRRNL